MILVCDNITIWHCLQGEKYNILLVVDPGKEYILFWIKKMCFQYFFHLFAFSSFCFFIFSLLKQRWRKSQSASFFHFPRLTLALSLHCSRILAPVSLLSSSLLSSPCSRLPAPVSALVLLFSFSVLGCWWNRKNFFVCRLISVGGWSKVWSFLWFTVFFLVVGGKKWFM